MSEKISALDDYDSPADPASRIPIEDSGSNYAINGNDLVTPFLYRVIDGSFTGITLVAQLEIIFDDTTDRSIPALGTVGRKGWHITLASIQVPATGHSFILPSGVTWDGTNRKVTLTAATSRVIATAVSPTRFVVLYDKDVSYAAS